MFVLRSLRQERAKGCRCLYSPSFREGSFSETQLPLNTILGNRACSVRGSFNTTTYRYTPLQRFALLLSHPPFYACFSSERTSCTSLAYPWRDWFNFTANRCR